jgi:hypothetical protein
MAHLCSEELSRGEREVPRPRPVSHSGENPTSAALSAGAWGVLLSERPFAKNLHVTFCTSHNHLAVTLLTAPVGIEL